ncbi:OmpA family protein [Nocardiopsis rhodophaea]|uniref:OmpA family protein n=1 Tax=Nocardiopsis rhodophaea TaxID=280238 RepID=UPI0031E3EF68
MTRHLTHRSSRGLGSVLTAAALLASGCSLGGGGEDPADGPGGTDDPSTALEYSDGPFVRRGTFGQHIERKLGFEVEAVERYDDRTVLRFITTAAGEEDEDTPDAFSGGILSRTPVNVWLVDPVGQRLYYPARDDDGDFIGSEELPYTVIAGAEYKMEAHYPRLPDDVERITVITPGTTGPFTGIPVTDADGPRDVPTEEPPHYRHVEEGDTIVPVVNDAEVSDDYGWNLYGITEGTAVQKDSSATEEKVELNADVLFEFDKADLADDAEDVLKQVVAETRERADPDKPPITIVGHTDGKGDDDYNQKLSEERAETVHQYLKAELGSAYEYKTEGRGSSEPIADEGGSDDEEARARNRRVEISYKIKETRVTTELTETEEKSEDQVDGGAIAPPAPFREERGEVVATATASIGRVSYELEVLPFFRDGAYLVANLRITNTSPDTDLSVVWDGGFKNDDYHGADFGAFSAVDPETDIVYRAVRIGEQGTRDDRHYLEAAGYPWLKGPGTTNDVSLYLPAPPTGVTSVTFDAGAFGTFEDVPIE